MAMRVGQLPCTVIYLFKIRTHTQKHISVIKVCDKFALLFRSCRNSVAIYRPNVPQIMNFRSCAAN